MVKGPFTILDGEGNEYRVERSIVALCRCGHSNNKPFCDGSHARVGFESRARVPVSDDDAA
jgi:CDGSH-type Zn-finger protein